MYREHPRLRDKEGELVTVRRYSDTVSAEADRAHLGSEGIVAHVIDGASFNPVLANAIGAVRLLVGPADAQRAEEILGAVGPEESAADDEAEGTVRCPRCELAYCAFERPRMHNAAPGVAFLTLPITMIFEKPRWRCHKCAFAWDDPKEGPKEITRLDAGVPRPAFRLRRAHAGMGLFFGGVAGLLGAFVAQGIQGLALPLFVACAFAGAMIGRALQYDVCSVPECRTRLPSNAEECPGCKSGIGGVIHTAEEHYAEAASFRRELAASAPKKKRLKKAALRPTT